MAAFFYTTIERPDGGKGLLYDHFDDEERAYAKLYTILAAAAVSGIPYHSGHLLRSDGTMLESRVFDRRVDPAPEPQPEPEEPETAPEEEVEA